MSDAKSDANLILSAALAYGRAPVLTDLTAIAWDKFEPQFQQYCVAVPQHLSLAQCVSPKVVTFLQWDLPKDVTWGDSSCTDSVVRELIYARINPLSRQEALSQFRSIKFPSHASLVETMTQYCVRYTSLHSRLSESVCPDMTDIRRVFLERLPSSLVSLQEYLRCERHTDFSEFCKATLSWCRQAQSLNLVTLGSASKSTKQNRRQRSSPPAQEEEHSGPPATSAPSNPHKHLVCHYCNKPGHIQPNCEKKKRDLASSPSSTSSSAKRDFNLRPRQPQQGQPKQSVNAVSPEVPTTSDPSPTHTVNNIECVTPTESSDRRRLPIALFHLAAHNGSVSNQDSVQTLAALLDSGSSFNLIREDVLHRLPPQYVVTRPSHTSMLGPDGKTRLESSQQVELCVTVASSFEHPVSLFPTFQVVSELSHPCILGNHFIRSNHLWDVLQMVATASESPLNVSIPTAKATPWDPFDGLPASSATLQEHPVDDPALHHRLQALTEEFSDLFLESDQPCSLPAADFSVPPDFHLRPSKPRRISPVLADKVKTTLDDYTRLGIIESSASPYVSPLHVTLKSSGGVRLTVDYREANMQLKNIPFAPLSTELVVEQLQGKRFYGRLDLRNGYYQLELADSLRDYFAFVSPFGQYRFRRLPQGLKISPSLFYTAISQAFADIEGCQVYMDDLLLGADSASEFLALVRSVFARCQQLHLGLNPRKCALGLKTLNAVGFLLSEQGYTIPQDKRTKVANLAVPKTLSELRTFLGMANYFKKFIPNYADRAQPLYHLTRKGVKFQWTDVHQRAFEDLQASCDSVPLLTFPSRKGFLHLYSDASTRGVGAVLLESDHEGPVLSYDPAKHRLIAFLSKAFTDTEARWSVIEMELFAAFYSIKSWEQYLMGTRFTLYTDHNNLVFLHNTTNAKLSRYRLSLLGFDFTVVHIAGRTNVVADCFSRLPPPMPSTNTVSAVPSIQRPQFDQVHNTLVGHAGVAQTLARLRAAGLSLTKADANQVRLWIKSCALCQKVRTPPVPVVKELKHTMASKAWTKLTIDILGPLPKSQGNNSYILSAVDNFTRYVELRAIPAPDAMSTAIALLDICGRFGFFTELSSDRGANFCSSVIECLCAHLGLQQTFSVPYSPQSQGQVERRHKDIMRFLKCFTIELKCKDNWDTFLPLAARILNGMVHSVTGVAPAQLLYGAAIDINRELLANVYTSRQPSDTATITAGKDFVDELVSTQRRLLKAALQNQRNYLHRQLLPTAHLPPTTYEVGAQVLVRYPTRQEKFSCKYFGPCIVTERHDNSYKLRDVLNNTTFDVSVDRLQPYVHDPTKTLIDVATWDNQEYEVELIADHRLAKRKTDCSFLVKWLGFSDAYSTWEPYSHVKDLAVFKTYVRQHGLRL